MAAPLFMKCWQCSYTMAGAGSTPMETRHRSNLSRAFHFPSLRHLRCPSCKIVGRLKYLDDLTVDEKDKLVARLKRKRKIEEDTKQNDTTVKLQRISAPGSITVSTPIPEKDAEAPILAPPILATPIIPVVEKAMMEHFQALPPAVQKKVKGLAAKYARRGRRTPQKIDENRHKEPMETDTQKGSTLKGDPPPAAVPFVTLPIIAPPATTPVGITQLPSLQQMVGAALPQAEAAPVENAATRPVVDAIPVMMGDRQSDPMLRLHIEAIRELGSA